MNGVCAASLRLSLRVSPSAPQLSLQVGPGGLSCVGRRQKPDRHEVCSAFFLLIQRWGKTSTGGHYQAIEMCNWLQRAKNITANAFYAAWRSSHQGSRSCLLCASFMMHSWLRLVHINDLQWNYDKLLWSYSFTANACLLYPSFLAGTPGRVH